ncbi:hypothetical protein QUA85_06380, partial [Microcoleus sp. F8-C4]
SPWRELTNGLTNQIRSPPSIKKNPIPHSSKNAIAHFSQIRSPDRQKIRSPLNQLHITHRSTVELSNDLS